MIREIVFSIAVVTIVLVRLIPPIIVEPHEGYSLGFYVTIIGLILILLSTTRAKQKVMMR